MGTGTSLPGVAEARQVFGLTYEEIATSIRADNATLCRWREGASPSPVHYDRLVCLADLVASAVAHVGGEHVDTWLTSRLAVFGGRSPKDMILAGRAETVLGVLLSREFLVKALAQQRQGPARGSMTEAEIALWRADVDGMFDRMQTPDFATKALKVLDEPLRIRVPEHRRHTTE
jgi:hypothetical protein